MPSFTPRESNAAPSASEFGWLVARLASHGFGQQAIRDAIGTGPAGRTRRQIADELTAVLRTLPKAETQTPGGNPR